MPSRSRICRSCRSSDSPGSSDLTAHASRSLQPQDHLPIEDITVLLTSLREPVAFYERLGIARACERVQAHFAVLHSAIAREDGAVVKTIGDGVMAVFRHPATAVRALLRAHELLAGDMTGIQPVQLKAGAHHGPCIAVDSNAGSDYLGSTVEIAAQLARTSEGGDIVISDVVFADADVADIVRRLELNVVTDELLPDGCSVPVRLHRLRAPRVTWSRC